MLDIGVFYKECNKCYESLPSKKFRIRGTKNGARRPTCLNCQKQTFKVYYIKNKDQQLEKMNVDKRKNPIKKILKQAKSTALIKKLDFNLIESDIVLPIYCKYLGIELTNKIGNGVVWSNYSIDRIDSSKGYIKGNVEIISRKANSMKNMATKEELIIFSKNVLKIHKD